MTIANQIFTQNGVVPLGPDGCGVLAADPAAPNGVAFDAIVTLRVRGGETDRYATIDFPVADYSAWPQLHVAWVFIGDAGITRRAVSPKIIVPATGQITLDGGEEAVFGRAAFLGIVGYELYPSDADGRMGFSDGRHAVTGTGDPSTPPAETIVPGAPPSFTSGLVAEEAFTISAGGPILSAPPDLVVTVTFDQADDTDETNLVVGVTVTDLTAPAGAAGKYLRIVRAISAESTGYTYTDRSQWAFVAAAAEDVSIASAPAFLSAPTEGYLPAYAEGTVSNGPADSVTHTLWEVDEAEGGTPTEVTLSDDKFPTAGMKGFAFVRMTVDDSSLAAPLIADSPRVAVIHLPRFTSIPVLSELTESAAFTRTPAETEYVTGSTSIVVSYEDADDDSGTGNDELVVPGGVMPAAVNAYVEVTETMTDPLLTGAGITSRTAKSGWVACADAEAAVPPTPVPTFGATVIAYEGTSVYGRPVVDAFSDAETGDIYEWTTSALDPIPADQIERMEFSGGKWRTQMNDAGKRVNPNSQTPSTRTDYSVFRHTGTGPYVLAEPRGENIRFRRARELSEGVYGPWSIWNGPHTCPVITSGSSSDDWPKPWIPMTYRSPEAKAAAQLDGPGLQVLRSFAVSKARPGLILAGMDQNFQWESLDGGETMGTPAWNGQTAGRQGLSVWIDPDDADRQIVAYCGPPGTFTESGLFRTLDAGHSCTKVLALPGMRGTNTLRHNMQLLCHKPGGSASTRAIFMMAGIGGASGDNAVQSIQLYRSINGGATWQTRGPAQSVATYGNGSYWDYEIAFRPSGDLLLRCGPKGLWWSDDDGLTWTKATGLPAGAIHHMQIASNGTVFAGTNSGLYRATNGKAYTAVPNFGTTACRYFGLSPEDDNYLVAAKVNSPNPVYTTNALATTPTWTQGVAHPRLGQAYSTAHALGSADHGGVVGLYGDKRRFFFMTQQHLAVTVDNGANVRHGGFLYCGQHTRGDIGFHPTDWRIMVAAQQDTVSMATVDGGLAWSSDQITNPDSGAGLQIANAVGWNQYLSGAGAMVHSSRRTFFSAGRASGNRCIVGEEVSAQGVIGAAHVYTAQVSSLSDNARIDPNSANRGYIGRFRSTNLNAGSLSGVTWTQMAYHFVTLTGFGGSTVIYGTNTSGQVIYRSEDFGATWTAWRTCQRSFRPEDSRPQFFACPNHAARVYAVSGAGYLTRIVGTSNPTETTIFDARNYVAGYPDYRVYSFAVDPFNPNLGYLTLYMWGCGNVYRCTNLTTTTGAAGDWECIAQTTEDGCPHVDLEVRVHPLTSDVIVSGSHGSHVHKPPDGHRATYGIANSLWDTINAYFKTVQ